MESLQCSLWVLQVGHAIGAEDAVKGAICEAGCLNVLNKEVYADTCITCFLLCLHSMASHGVMTLAEGADCVQ